MSGRDKKILIVFIGIVICVAFLYFGAFKFKGNAEALAFENQNLQSRLADLSEKASKAEEYTADIAKMSEKIDALKEEFPSYLRIENHIMDAVTLEKESKVSVSTIAIESPQAVDLSATADTTEGETGETTDAETTEGTEGTEGDTTEATGENTNAYELYEVPNTFNFSSNTLSMKKLLNLIVDADNRQCVTSLTVAYNGSDSTLSGTLTFSSYFLLGLEKDYEDADIPAMKHGQDDIFRTGSKGTTSEEETTEAN